MAEIRSAAGSARAGVAGAASARGEAPPPAFVKLFKKIVDAETVPEGIPFAVPWDELAKKHGKIPGKVRKIRGKLNVPRERFHLRGKDEYLWAGLMWR